MNRERLSRGEIKERARKFERAIKKRLKREETENDRAKSKTSG